MEKIKNDIKSVKSFIKKLSFTLINLRSTARHYYGNKPFSVIRFIYYGLFRINTFLVFEADLTGSVPEIETDSELKVVTPTLEELDRLRKGKALPREFYYDEIHGVKTCYVALYGGEIAYIHWIYTKGDYSRFLVLQDGVCEINYVTTLPRFRGKRLSLKMLAYASNSLRKRGYKKIVMVVHQNNEAFIKMIRCSNFMQTRRIKTLGLFNRKIVV